MDGQGTKRRRKNAENFNRLSKRCTNVTDDRHTDVTFANKTRFAAIK